jgi:predicted 3-demethylubiquinone-9 3-methyltransferase (glyoxalase superfamily)
MFVGDQAGRAEEAMTFYTSLFKNSGITSIARYGPGGPDREGTVQHARFTLDGQEYMAMDSAHEHNFTFTPSMSIFVTCEAEDEIDNLFERLSAGGAVLMDLQNHGFSRKFGWVNDRFGVSWQLNLP